MAKVKRCTERHPCYPKQVPMRGSQGPRGPARPFFLCPLLESISALEREALELAVKVLWDLVPS